MPTLVRRVALLALAPLLLSGCWFNVGGNALHTGFNALESSVKSDSFASLHKVWSASVEPADETRLPSSVAVFGNTLFIESEQGMLQAYDAAGNTNCSGTPKSCQALWTADAGGAPQTIVQTDPATDGSTVFVGGADGKLYAFDAGGNTNCSGTPKTCAPLWTGPLGSAAFDPVVSNGRVFIGSADGHLFAFDASGNANCGGTPRTCAPLWRANSGAQYSTIGNLPAPAVTNAAVLYPSGNGLDAFDPAGATNCGGSPRTCTPLWSASAGTGLFPLGWPVVGGGVVYLSLSTGGGASKIAAFDAGGQRSCGGTPTVCAPLWIDNAQSTTTVTPALGPDGLLYAGFSSLEVFSTDGTTGCSGSPVVCQPLHTASLPGLTLAPSLADDVVVLGVLNLGGPSAIMGFKQGTLDPLGSFALGSSQPTIFPGLLAITNGTIYESTSDGHLQAWAP
jgi:outer membrane protein assembly factor BamB